MHRRVPPFGLYVKKIVNLKFFGNSKKKKSQKWTTQELSNIARNKVMKNQPIQGIPGGLLYDNQSGGIVFMAVRHLGNWNFGIEHFRHMEFCQLEFWHMEF